MYLALQQPWRASAVDEVAADARIADPAPAPTTKPGKRRPRSRRPDAPAANDGGELADSGLEDTAPVELSAADRRLVWRGDAVALPPASHDFSKEDSGRALTDAEIDAVVRSNSRAVIDCLARAATGTDLRTPVTLQLLVDGRGRVTRHRVHAPQYLFAQGVAECVAEGLRAWRFPATGAPTVVTAPFELG